MAICAANWKMNGDPALAEPLVGGLTDRLAREPQDTTVVVCPPAHILGAVRAHGGGLVQIGAQDCSDEAGPGAFTGEISAPMLAAAGCTYVILGHSERRARHAESDALVRAKAAQALAANLIPIVCVGESLEEREAGKAVEVVSRQLRASLPAGAAEQRVVIAYEPIWAIGTGRSATPDDVGEMHGALRAVLDGDLPDAPAAPILYGGSVKPANAAELFAVPGVDGALVGGASLKLEDFWSIVTAG